MRCPSSSYYLLQVTSQSSQQAGCLANSLSDLPNHSSATCWDMPQIMFSPLQTYVPVVKTHFTSYILHVNLAKMPMRMSSPFTNNTPPPPLVTSWYKYASPSGFGQTHTRAGHHKRFDWDQCACRRSYTFLAVSQSELTDSSLQMLLWTTMTSG